MKALKYNIYIKIGLIFILMLLLLIPSAIVKGLVFDRENTQRNAVNEVSSKWAFNQTVTGPYISIPYLKPLKRYNETAKITETYFEREYIYILPETLKADVNLNPQKRTRGIYEVVLYNAKINFSGKFLPIDLKDLNVSQGNLELKDAKLIIGIDDLRGIKNQIFLQWNDDKSLFDPGNVSNDLISSGINTPIKIDLLSDSYAFNINLDLNGSQELFFNPIGKTTDVNIISNWENPSFTGMFLPDSREISENGFKAHWNILHLNRNFPQQWISNKYSLKDSSFGVSLLLPMDNYQKTYRAVNYAILFIGFTFLTFFFIEVLNKKFIHPVQYILVGISLIVFYVLLLSVSEHIPFNFAYIISALLTLFLIALYMKAILKNTKLVLLIFGILFILYAFIFIIMQLQDYALLVGSIGLFSVLALTMYLSRKIDWYNLNIEKDSKTIEE